MQWPPRGHPRVACPLPGILPDPLLLLVRCLAVDFPHLLQLLVRHEAPEIPGVAGEIAVVVEGVRRIASS